jgi:hypothetical protein
MLLKDWRKIVQPSIQRDQFETNRWCNPQAVLDKSMVADLSSLALERMTCEELARVICAVELPQLLDRDRNCQLPHGDREALLRLAYLARNCCRNQGY